MEGLFFDSTIDLSNICPLPSLYNQSEKNQIRQKKNPITIIIPTMTLEAKYSIEADIMSAIQNLIPEGFSFSFSLFHQAQNITQSQIAEQIQTIVLQYFEMSKEQLLSKGKAGKKPLVRKFICKFIRQYTTLSLKETSRYTHHKPDHSTVIDSIEVLSDWLQVDDEIISMHNQLNLFILSQIKYKSND